MAKKKKEIKMTMTQFNYEIVLNIGNYQSIRIGGEWSVTDAPTTEQVVKIDAELRKKVAEVVESRKASAQPQPQSEEDKRELVTTSQKDEARLKAILKKIQDGTPEETVRKYFRFDEKAEFLVNTALQDVMRS